MSIKDIRYKVGGNCWASNLFYLSLENISLNWLFVLEHDFENIIKIKSLGHVEDYLCLIYNITFVLSNIVHSCPINNPIICIKMVWLRLCTNRKRVDLFTSVGMTQFELASDECMLRLSINVSISQTLTHKWFQPVHNIKCMSFYQSFIAFY